MNPGSEGGSRTASMRGNAAPSDKAASQAKAMRDAEPTAARSGVELELTHHNGDLQRLQTSSHFGQALETRVVLPA